MANYKNNSWYRRNGAHLPGWFKEHLKKLDDVIYKLDEHIAEQRKINEGQKKINEKQDENNRILKDAIIEIREISTDLKNCMLDLTDYVKVLIKIADRHDIDIRDIKKTLKI